MANNPEEIVRKGQSYFSLSSSKKDGNEIKRMFTEESIIRKVRTGLPKLLKMAQIECYRGGKTGMEVGCLRERVIISLLISIFGKENVMTDIPITEPGIDVRLYDNPISIKTTSNYGPFKLVWTVDADSVRRFRDLYNPDCDILFATIVPDGTGGIYSIPQYVQDEVFNRLGRDGYIKLPKEGTNPRGAEITKEALHMLLEHPRTMVIKIDYRGVNVKYDPNDRWVKAWREIPD